MDDAQNQRGDTGSYLIKTFGSSKKNCRFYPLPKVIERAKQALPDEAIIGFLACALERAGRMTGLMFCDRRHTYPEGLPAHTPPITQKFYRSGYLVVQASTGGLFVVAHWYFENGEIGPFYVLH
jgi:hypothetical protein